MTDSYEERLKRAYISLEGLSVGDAFGGFYELNSALRDRLNARILFKPPWHFTDDTNMALSIVAILRRYNKIDQDALALHFAKYYDRKRGYGMSTRGLVARIQKGQYWKDAAFSAFGGQGSFGNGGAMRVAPLGGYFADDLDLVIENACQSAEITHAHPEGIAGTIAVAIAAAYAWRMRSEAPEMKQHFLQEVVQHVPDSEVRSGILKADGLAADTPIQKVVKVLGNGSRVSAQDTVPFALWCAKKHLDNYEEAIWLTGSGMGDTDTTCAIVGGIVALYTGHEGIPEVWKQSREPLSEWVFREES
jgi:ADP-ribosylglycohydrolase